MRPIPLKNERLVTLLSTLTDICYTPTVMQYAAKFKSRRDDLIPEHYGVSDEYLRTALTKKITDFGFPRTSLGMGMNGVPTDRIDIIDPIEKQVKKVGKFLGTHVNALTMIYPDKGFIGWHHNGNAPGYNILMSYSQDGEGDFRYYDKKEDKIVVLNDTPGWFVKVGYYPSERSETERIYWHAAQTKKQRVSVAWIINHRPMWLSMIEEITGGDYDKDFVQSQGNP